SAGWRFIAVAVGRLGGLRAAERGAEGVDGVALEAEPDVGVNGDGDADAGGGGSDCVAEQGTVAQGGGGWVQGCFKVPLIV
ncbi:hypothetical protein, partial [Saccharothrix sp. ST-888]|uniref:hypothetical protein n=1 Tax=Saccharothrix sp. ST-888 TaxID=1427391 RepID=UPI0005EC5244